MAPAPAPAPFSVGLLCAYRQYKTDTETIASWLKTTAVKHGYKFDGQDGTTIRTSDFIPSKFLRPVRPLSSGVLFTLSKFAAFMQGLESPPTPVNDNLAHFLYRQMLPFSEHLQIILIANICVPSVAQQIVAGVKQARFTLQPTIHQAFRRAIISRKDCTAWYEENTEGQWTSNVKHACMLQF